LLSFLWFIVKITTNPKKINPLVIFNQRFGNDFIANVGGAINGHPMGAKAGTLAMRQAIDNDLNKEYDEAVNKWSIID